MNLEMLVAKVQAAGVVGAGGAGFPTHVKLNNHCESVLINGAECEPLLQVDQQLLLADAGVLAGALEEVVEATGAKKGIFALKAKYAASAAALSREISGKPKLEMFLLGDFYPAGDEQVLVYEVLGKVVPPGGIPIQVGALVLNVETLFNIAKACKGEPVTEKYVTVAGAVRNPLTVKVPIGLPVRRLLEMAGGPVQESFRVLEGGPMMGKEVKSLDQGIGKTTKGLIVLPAEHRLWRHKEMTAGIMLKRALAVCCQCSACTDLCPRHLLGHSLEPHRVLRNIIHNTALDPVGITGAQLCSECGVCDYYACPMDISPRIVNRAVKQELAKRGFKYQQSGSPRPSPERDLRKLPVKRLIARLGLTAYYKPAPLDSESVAENRVRIALNQHVGSPAQPVVEPGSPVAAGQVIAEVPAGQLGSLIHASISGVVLKVKPYIEIAREIR